MVEKTAQCFLSPHAKSEPHVFHCEFCVAARKGARAMIFVGYAAFLFWFWGII
jgi:hypothetical protein